MSLLIGQPHIQFCPKCDWKNKMIVNSDCLTISKCPKCGADLSLKAVSDLSWVEKLAYKLSSNTRPF
ncbi:hypothetical protein [Otariodibacter sp.]|uniref:hypothetical protein n=1 Tax=Otariodibacter sp. TaxID=3030919 RepID=UPI00262FC61A|nr:hypothetical protein [Otariodibacter sp.]